MRFIFILFCLSIVLSACQDQTEQAPTEAIEESVTDTENQSSEATTQTKSVESNPNFVATTITPEVMYVKGNRIELTNQKVVTIPNGGGDTTLIFLTRHGERKQGKTSLSPMGGIHATRLANVLRDANLKTVYWNDNAGMQTGFHTAGANEAELLNFNVQDLGALVNTIKKNDLGSRLAVVSDIITVPEVMNRFLNGGPFKAIGLEDYDDLYIMVLKGEEVVDIFHTRMYALQ